MKTGSDKLVCTAALVLALAACSDSEASNVQATATTRQAAPADGSLQEYQVELLDLAYRAASAFPHDPHLKNRSRAQEAVVVGCFELDAPQLALRYIAGIDNWRQGIGYADYAHWCAEHGYAAEAERYLQLAAQAADSVRLDPNPQAWRRDRVRARIARTWLLLGDRDKAEDFGGTVEDSELATIAGARAQALSPTEYAAELAGIDAVLTTAGNFEQVRAAMTACAELFDRFYGDAIRRAELRERLVHGYATLPREVRVGYLGAAADSALVHGDQDQALELIETARGLIDEGARQPPEYRLPLLARLAILRHRAGDVDGARREVAAAMAAYDGERERIVDICRAGTLRPLAEAYHAIGNRPAALVAYERAVEEGVHNPNSRPRADDLVATCVSLAVHRCEPDAELRARLLEVCEGLGEPW